MDNLPQARSLREVLFLLRGIALGTLGFGSFFLVGALLPRLAIAPTYGLAALAALTVNGVFLYLAQ